MNSDMTVHPEPDRVFEDAIASGFLSRDPDSADWVGLTCTCSTTLRDGHISSTATPAVTALCRHRRHLQVEAGNE